MIDEVRRIRAARATAGTPDEIGDDEVLEWLVRELVRTRRGETATEPPKDAPMREGWADMVPRLRAVERRVAALEAQLADQAHRR